MDAFELEIALRRVQADSYETELRLRDPTSDAETAPERARCAFDFKSLLPLTLDPVPYGQTLARQLFADPKTLEYFGQVMRAVEATDRDLRLRLAIDPTAAELHALRWELLCDPRTGDRLTTSERVLFSRFLQSQDWRPIRLRPRSAMRALVAVSAPTDAAEEGLAPVDLAGEVRRAREALAGLDVTVLGEEAPLTLDGLIASLREGTDILYLVAHGRFDPASGPVVLLQDNAGQAAWIPGDDLAQRIAELRERPRLVVLASCDSAAVLDVTPDRDPEHGNSPNDLAHASSPQTALAPRLAAAGVPAILAMQGQIDMDTVAKALPRFFRELLKDGQLDRALAVARGEVRDRWDAWMLALFLRLRGGRLWSQPGFASVGAGTGRAGAGDEVPWDGLVNEIVNKRCTPIIGWGLAEGIYGGTGDLAERLARQSRFPLAPYQRSDLAQVSQFLGVAQSNDNLPLDRLKAQMREEVLARHLDLLQREDASALIRFMLASGDRPEVSLGTLMRKVAALRRRDPQDPYRLAAALPAPVFIDATPDSLFSEALREAGKAPVERRAVWRLGTEPPPRYEDEPSVAKPLVYQILGHLSDPTSLVLTQDDYFNYLIGVTRNRALIPKAVANALAAQTLLFLGFQLTDWSFRVLFRLIHSQEGGRSEGRRGRLPHLAVQLDPEGSPFTDPNAAREFLIKTYQKDQIHLYWGSGEDFLRELAPRLPARSPLEWDQGGDDDY
jgi:hypothetical protein